MSLFRGILLLLPSEQFKAQKYLCHNTINSVLQLSWYSVYPVVCVTSLCLQLRSKACRRWLTHLFEWLVGTPAYTVVPISCPDSNIQKKICVRHVFKLLKSNPPVIIQHPYEFILITVYDKICILQLCNISVQNVSLLPRIKSTTVSKINALPINSFLRVALSMPQFWRINKQKPYAIVISRLSPEK